MPVPTHSPSCTSRAIKLECWNCGEEVFYFFCSCGTKVFFDSLGSPWPIHDCNAFETKDLLEQIFETYGVIDDSVINRLKIICEEKDTTLPPDALSKITNFLHRNVSKRIKLEIQPNESELGVYGKITGVNHSINFYKKFNLEKGNISQMLLGKLANEQFSEIILETLPNKQNQIKIYRVFIPERVIKQMKLTTKKFITIKILTHSFVSGQKIWLVDEIASDI